MKTILFQGDSITDTGRIREKPENLGTGYALMTAAKVRVDYPGQYECVNRGISGNRSVDLYARIKAHGTNLKPDIMTVLIGINYVWHEFGSQNGVDAPKYERILDMFFSEFLETCPDTKIFLLEPFVLKGTANEEKFDEWWEETQLRVAACRRLAQKHNLTFIPVQEKLVACIAKYM